LPHLSVLFHIEGDGVGRSDAPRQRDVLHAVHMIRVAFVILLPLLDALVAILPP